MHAAVTIFRTSLALLMFAFSTLVFVQVMIRYVVHIGIFGLNDVISLLAVWMYFLGAGYAASSGGHISASLVDVVFADGGVTQRIIGVVANAVTAAVMLVFAWWAAQYALWAWERGAVSDELRLPRIHFAIPIVAGCAMMSWFFAATALSDLKFLAADRNDDV